MRATLALLSLSIACAPASDSTLDAEGAGSDGAGALGLTTAIVDTNQRDCTDTKGETVDCAGSGQDGERTTFAPAYTDHGDGTVTDDITGLTWQQGMPDKMQYADAEPYCEDLTLGGADDWRLPSTKELYSLMDFSGITGQTAYIDDATFDFDWGDESAGERDIDTQWATTTVYADTVMGGQECFFGVNHADGRIKCYPTMDQDRDPWRVRCVRGNADYGVNAFTDNGDGTVSDDATGLMWTQADSGGFEAGEAGDGTLDWPGAIAFCEDLELAGHADWHLPDAKQLHSLFDPTRSPGTTGSAAIDPVFEATGVENEAGQADFGFYWTSTSHYDGLVLGDDAVYISFGRGMGQMEGEVMDVHGAGAQRGDPKTGERDDYPVLGNGPQGDAQRVFNLARCVR